MLKSGGGGKPGGEEKMDTLLSTSQIPIIDLAHCGTEECPIRSVVNRVGGQLFRALSEKGVALLVNHGIPEEKIKMAYSHLDDFCKLPDDTKEMYLRKTGNHGYIKPGQERFDGESKDIRHTFNICTLKPEASLPEEPLPGFREHISDLATDFQRLSSLLLQALAIGLEQPHKYFLDKHSHILDGESENQSTFRLLYYPPLIEDDGKNELQRGTCKYSQQRCAKDEIDLSIPEDYRKKRAEEEEERQQEDEKRTRCGAHCDYGTFTLLVQDSEGGLEVKLPGVDKWKRVGHLPGAILINAGELLSTWTNDKITALLHRVVIPEEEALKARGRHSIAFFVHPDNCIDIEPFELPTSSSSNSLDSMDKKPKNRKKSFKTAKTKIYNAYQHVQRRFKETYAS